MASLTKIWTFDADAQGFTRSDSDPNTTFAWLGADGSPAAGCLLSSATVAAGSNHAAQMQTSHALTWQDYGVPAGVNVTQVQLLGVAWNYAASVQALDITVGLGLGVIDVTTGFNALGTGTLFATGGSPTTLPVGWQSAGPGMLGNIVLNYGDPGRTIYWYVSVQYQDVFGFGNFQGAIEDYTASLKVDSIDVQINTDAPGGGGGGGPSLFCTLLRRSARILGRRH